MRKLGKIGLCGLAIALPCVAMATGEPLDLTATGTTIAGYIATAAGAGLAILAGFYGLKVLIRAFKAVK